MKTASVHLSCTGGQEPCNCPPHGPAIICMRVQGCVCVHMLRWCQEVCSRSLSDLLVLEAVYISEPLALPSTGPGTPPAAGVGVGGLLLPTHVCRNILA